MFICFQILKVLSENAVAVRTKAMKCLTAVIEADPGVLARVSWAMSSVFKVFVYTFRGHKLPVCCFLPSDFGPTLKGKKLLPLEKILSCKS